MEESRWYPKSAIALMSGGMDSTFSAYWVAHYHPGSLVHGVFINYGQKGVAWEWQAAKRIMDVLKMKATYLNIAEGVRRILEGSIIQGIGQDPAEDPRAKDRHGRPASFVPGRNLLHLAYAAPLIDHYGYNIIVGGWNAVDVEYPDCQGEFLETMAQAISLALGRGPEGLYLMAPSLQLTKAEEVEIAHKGDWNIPWEVTRSCYKDDIMACGYCDSCLVRARAFHENGLRDPLYTEGGWEYVVESLWRGGYLSDQDPPCQ